MGTTYPEERVALTLAAVPKFVDAAEQQIEAGLIAEDQLEPIQKFATLVYTRMAGLLPTSRYSVGAATDVQNVLGIAFKSAGAQWPSLSSALLKLGYLVTTACDAVASDGNLLLATQWRCYPTKAVELDGAQRTVITDNLPYKVIGGNRNSTSAKNTPRLCAKNGDRILMEPNGGPNFRFTYLVGDPVPTDPTVPYTIIMGRRPGEWVVEPDPGEAPFYHGVYHEHFDWPVLVENLTIRKCANAGIGTENPASGRFGGWPGTHKGFAPIKYENLKIDGGWDATKVPLIVDGKTVPLGQDGLPCVKLKWGMLGYHHGIGRSKEEAGLTIDGLDISGVWEEHALYWHNALGTEWDYLAHSIRNFRIRHCGRTAFQYVARIGEGPAGKGIIRIHDGYIEDVCLQSGGGGSAITMAGRHYGAFDLKGITVRLGCNQALAAPRNANITGALVVYCGQGSENIPTSDVVIDGCDFEFGQFYVGQGSARRPLVKIGNDGDRWEGKVVERFTLKNTRLKGWPGCRETLNISAPTSFGSLTLDSKNQITGPCVFAGTRYSDYDAMLVAIDGVAGVKVL